MAAQCIMVTVFDYACMYSSGGDGEGGRQRVGRVRWPYDLISNAY